MTVHIYRFRRISPVDQTQLRSKVGTTATLSVNDGGQIVDITSDDATDSPTDLTDEMTLRGYSLVSTDPTDDPADTFTPKGSGSGGSKSGIWRFSTSTTAADPGIGRFRFNNAAYASITAVYVDDIANDPAFDFGLIFLTVAVGDIMIVQQNDDATSAVEFTIDSVTDNTGWWTFGVTYVQDAGGDQIENNKSSTIGFFSETDSDAIHVNKSAEISGITEKVTPVGADLLVIEDSADTNSKKRVQISNLPGGGSLPVYLFPAEKLSNPLTSDWSVNALAPLAEDTNNTGILVRLFDDTTEEGIGFALTVPSGAASMQIFTLARAESGPAGAVVAKLLFYEREVSDNAAVTAWSSSIALTDVDLPITTEFFQEDETDKTLASWGLTAGKTHQVQITRTSVSDTLVGDLALNMIRIEFT